MSATSRLQPLNGSSGKYIYLFFHNFIFSMVLVVSERRPVAVQATPPADSIESVDRIDSKLAIPNGIAFNIEEPVE